MTAIKIPTVIACKSKEKLREKLLKQLIVNKEQRITIDISITATHYSLLTIHY